MHGIGPVAVAHDEKVLGIYQPADDFMQLFEKYAGVMFRIDQVTDIEQRLLQLLRLLELLIKQAGIGFGQAGSGFAAWRNPAWLSPTILFYGLKLGVRQLEREPEMLFLYQLHMLFFSA